MISSQAKSRHNSDLPPTLTHLLVHWQIICRDRISLRLYHHAGSCRLGPPGQAGPGTNHYDRPHPRTLPRGATSIFPKTNIHPISETSRLGAFLPNPQGAEPRYRPGTAAGGLSPWPFIMTRIIISSESASGRPPRRPGS